MKEVVVAISGINATDNPGPGCAVGKSLQEAKNKMDLVGLSYDVHDPGNYMTEVFSNSFLMPYPTNGWLALNSSLEEIQRKSGINILIPCLDSELPLIIRNQTYLENRGIRTLLPTEEQFELRSKDRLVNLSEEIGCKHPRTEVVFSLDEMINVLEKKIHLPAVIKGRFYKAYVVSSIDMAVLKAAEIAADWGFPLLVQEKVEGQEINLIGLCDQNGMIVGRVSIKKQLTTHLGKVWTAVTIKDDRLDRLCDQFCKFTGWRGPFELECIVYEQEIFIIEINPRFPAWVYFATAVGINLPERLVDLICNGFCDTRSDYSVGKYLVRYTSEFVSDLSYFQNLILTKNRNGE